VIESDKPYDEFEAAAMKLAFTEELKPSADDLLFFIDDVGHEAFAGDQDYYGLGGCALSAAAYQIHLKERWSEVRKAINGAADAPLHAFDMSHDFRHFATLSEFFLDRSFVRIAVTTMKNVTLPGSMHPCAPVLGQIKKEVEVVAEALRCPKVWVIVESSQRADPVVQACFSQLTSRDGSQTVSVEKCLIPKSSREQGLEIADFIVSAAGSEIRRRLRGQSGHARDFEDVFCRLPAEGCRYREVTGVELDPDGGVAVTGLALVS
jgi:hypothetical protein